MKFFKKYQILLIAILLIAFSAFQTVKNYQLNKDLEDIQDELSQTKDDLSDSEDKLDGIRSKLTDLQSRAVDLQSSISDLYNNRSSYSIEDVESEADDLVIDIETTQDEAGR